MEAEDLLLRSSHNLHTPVLLPSSVFLTIHISIYLEIYNYIYLSINVSNYLFGLFKDSDMIEL